MMTKQGHTRAREIKERKLPNGEIETQIIFEDGRYLTVVGKRLNRKDIADLFAVASELFDACAMAVDKGADPKEVDRQLTAALNQAQEATQWRRTKSTRHPNDASRH